MMNEREERALREAVLRLAIKHDTATGFHGGLFIAELRALLTPTPGAGEGKP
jgi:hypothetical protein